MREKQASGLNIIMYTLHFRLLTAPMWADRFGWALWRDSAPVTYSVSLNEGGGGAESQAAIFFACLYIVRVIFI